MWRMGVGILLCGCMCGSAWAARPFATDDAGVVAANHYEFETAVDYWQDQATVGMGFKHAISSCADLGLAFDYSALPEAEQAAGLLELGLKYVLLTDVLAVSAQTAAGAIDYTLALIAQQAIGPLIMCANAGYAAQAYARENVFEYALSLAADMEAWGLGAELTGAHISSPVWALGTWVCLTESLNIDSALQYQGDSEPVWSATTGLCLSFQPANLSDHKEE